MFAESTLAINEWMSHGGGLAFAGSFFWGMVSVLLSPCHMASIPPLIAYPIFNIGNKNTCCFYML